MKNIPFKNADKKAKLLPEESKKEGVRFAGDYKKQEQEAKKEAGWKSGLELNPISYEKPERKYHNPLKQTLKSAGIFRKVLHKPW